MFRKREGFILILFGLAVFAMFLFGGGLFSTPAMAQTPGDPLPAALPELLVLILGALAPPIFQVVTRYVKGEVSRFLVSLTLSGITGMAAILILKYPLEWSVPFITLLFTMASLAYKTIWKPIFNKTGFLTAKPTGIN